MLALQMRLKHKGMDLSQTNPYQSPPSKPGGPPVQSGKVHPVAIVSLVLGVLAWTIGCCCWLHVPLGLAAAITGGIGLHFANQGSGGKGMSIAGLVLGVAALIVLTILGIVGFALNLQEMNF